MPKPVRDQKLGLDRADFPDIGHSENGYVWQPLYTTTQFSESIWRGVATLNRSDRKRFTIAVAEISNVDGYGEQRRAHLRASSGFQYRFFVQETKIYFDTAMDQLGKTPDGTNDDPERTSMLTPAITVATGYAAAALDLLALVRAGVSGHRLAAARTRHRWAFIVDIVIDRHETLAGSDAHQDKAKGYDLPTFYTSFRSSSSARTSACSTYASTVTFLPSWQTMFAAYSRKGQGQPAATPPPPPPEWGQALMASLGRRRDTLSYGGGRAGGAGAATDGFRPFMSTTSAFADAVRGDVGLLC